MLEFAVMNKKDYSVIEWCQSPYEAKNLYDSLADKLSYTIAECIDNEIFDKGLEEFL